MITNIRDMWDGFENAEVYDRAGHLNPGFSGLIEVTRLIGKHTRAKGMAFIVEFKILRTNQEDVLVDSVRSWYVNMMKDSAHSNVAAFAAACGGITRDQKAKIKDLMPMFKEVLLEAMGKPDTNDFVGVKLHLETRLTKKKDGGDFTVYDFSPVAPAA